MKKILLLCASLYIYNNVYAQDPSSTPVVSNASLQIPFGKADTNLNFNWKAQGKKTPIEWGFDLAWLSEDNVRRGMAFSGKEVVDIMRLSFQPTYSVESGTFNSAQLKDLNSRISIVKKYCKEDITYNINCDHASLDEWYNDACRTSAERAEHWAKLIDMTADYYKSKGLTRLVSISPLNEPDYEWHELPTFKHRKADFLEINKLLKTGEAYKDKYADVRLCGGNTLNDDMAYEWWNYLKAYLDEGNTHQLAGSFDNYASFYEKLTAAGHHATNDELHNTMEAMVGVEYGMQTGIWWGTAERARGQFMKATYQGNPGDRLAYAENRPKWTAASVYRHADGTVQAFIGSSERQASTTSYAFISEDRDVYFNGMGPLRYYVSEIPGGTAYQTGQTNAETVIDMQSGEDVQPYINGTYRIVNKFANKSTGKGKYLGFKSNPGTNWKQLEQNYIPASKKDTVYQQWMVTPVDTRIGGDYSYYDFKMVGNNDLRFDILNWSLTAGGQVGSFPGGLGNNEQWYLQYAGDGWFYIRSKHSNLALSCSSTTVNAGNVTQQNFNATDEKQMWRFIPSNVEYDRNVPASPTSLTATALPASVQLTWQASEDEDVAEYIVLRTEKGAEDWNTIARGVAGTSFTDNTAEAGTEYEYAVCSMDGSLNRSEKSNIAEASPSNEKALICRLSFDENLYDNTDNGNHAVSTKAQFNSKNIKEGTAELNLTGNGEFVMLPSTVSHHDALTVSFWLKRTSTLRNNEQIFEFGNSIDEHIALTPTSNTKMRLTMAHEGKQEYLDATVSFTGYRYFTVTLDGTTGTVAIYQNGQLVATKENLTFNPKDIRATCHLLGATAFSSNPSLKGSMDDFRIYNYAMSGDEVKELYSLATTILEVNAEEGLNSAECDYSAQTYDLNGRPATSAKTNKVVIENGKKKIQK